MRYPDDNVLFSSTGDITATPPANAGLAEKIKVSYSPADSFENSIKIDASIFTNLRKVNIGMFGAGIPSPLLQHRT